MLTVASLKSSIVVVNQYTIKNSSAKGGSRGGTPGRYVLRYMARDDAVETLSPVRRHNIDDFVVRYMARDSATDVAQTKSQLRESFNEVDGYGGVAFGYGEVSLSHEQLFRSSADIQKNFDEGKTVLKTVLSFEPEYLKKHGIVDPDFVLEKRGDYRGRIDQMKLRMAIMHGMNRLGHQMDDMRYVGVIQVDTEHVHCHLAIVDAGVGRLAGDGTQKGKLSAADKSLIRRGVDAFLDEHQQVAHLSAEVSTERRNVVSYVRRWAQDQMLNEATPQFLLSCLPEDRRLWRFGSNNEAMRKPNALVQMMVSDVMEEPGSGVHEAMAKVREYATTRRDNEGLTVDEWNRLVDQGQNRLMERCVNGVYATLRALPEDALQVRTPMLDVMSMDYEEMVKQRSDTHDDLLDFGFKLRSYSRRKESHEKARAQNHDSMRSWEMARESGVATDDSAALYRFYVEEEEYHARCAAKYRHFLNFTPYDVRWEDQWSEVQNYAQAMLNVESMSRDTLLSRIKDSGEAERRGQEIYGQAGGRHLTEGREGRDRLVRRADRMREQYAKKVEDLRVSLASEGLTLHVVSDQDNVPEAQVSEGNEYEFSEVKAVDLHHLGYDFYDDVEISDESRSQFIEMAQRRSDALAGAVEYLERTDQTEVIDYLPVRDIETMKTLADRFTDDPAMKLPSKFAQIREKERVRRLATVRLDEQLSRQLRPVMDHQAQQGVLELASVSGDETERRVPGE